MTWQIALQSALKTFFLSILLKASLASVESSGKGRGVWYGFSRCKSCWEPPFLLFQQVSFFLWSLSPSFCSLILITHPGNPGDSLSGQKRTAVAQITVGFTDNVQRWAGVQVTCQYVLWCPPVVSYCQFTSEQEVAEVSELVVKGLVTWANGCEVQWAADAFGGSCVEQWAGMPSMVWTQWYGLYPSAVRRGRSRCSSLL